MVITMGCGDTCPFYPGKRYEDWVLDDPAGKDVDAVRPIRDDIRRRVESAARRPCSGRPELENRPDRNWLEGRNSDRAAASEFFGSQRDGEAINPASVFNVSGTSL